MNKTENPQAFPWANDADKQYNWINKGMTLRDYFAAQAMQSFIDQELFFDDVAESAYKVADQMLKARAA